MRPHLLLKTFTHPDRVRILRVLLVIGPTRVNDIVKALKSDGGPVVPQPEVSRRIGELADKGIVVRGRQRDPVSVAEPELVRTLLMTAGDLAERISEAERDEAADLSRQMRKLQMKRGRAA